MSMILFFGATRKASGVSSLIRAYLSKPFSPRHRMTEYMDCYHGSDYLLFELGSSPLYQHLTTPQFRNKQIFVYCVDLTQPLDPDKIIQDIAKAKRESPGAQIILVGTKKDVISDEAPHDLDALARQEGYTAAILTSAKDNTGIDTLRAKIKEVCDALADRAADSAHSTPSNVSSVEQGHKLTDDDYDALYQATGALRASLPEDDPDWLKIDSAINDFYRIWLNHDRTFEEKKRALSDFEKQGKAILKPSSRQQARRALASVVTIALVTLLVATIGFGIGFGLGLWAGPGAFLTGILAGSAAAVAVVSASGAVGLMAGSALFFKKSPRMKPLDKVIDEAKALFPLIS